MPHPALRRLLASTLASSTLLAGGIACAQATGTHSEPTVVEKVEGAVKRGASAAERGVKKGVTAAASGVKRAASAAEHGASVAGGAIERTARRIGLPASGSSAASK